MFALKLKRNIAILQNRNGCLIIFEMRRHSTTSELNSTFIEVDLFFSLECFIDSFLFVNRGKTTYIWFDDIIFLGFESVQRLEFNFGIEFGHKYLINAGVWLFGGKVFSIFCLINSVE